MNATKVRELRKAGKLKEAYNKGKALLAEEPDNIWNKRAMAWVLYEFLKNAIEREDNKKVVSILGNIRDLHMPEDEELLFENLAWQTGKAVFQVHRQDGNNFQLINGIFDAIKDYHFPKPSGSYSFLYKAFHKGYKDWHRYLEFAQWWDYKNFVSEDYKKTAYNGRQIMSLVQKAYIAYSKKLLEGGPFYFIVDSGAVVDTDLVKEFLPNLSTVIEQHPEYKYLIYYKAKLLIELDENKQAFDTVLPFVREKQNESWVWTVLAEAADDNKQQIACFCKAMICSSGPEYVVKVRQKLAEQLINCDKFTEAKTEIKQLVKTRESKDWDIPQKVQNWMNSEWYRNASAFRDNQELYKEWSPTADKILYQTMPTTQVIVDYVNKDKQVLNFIDGLKNKGFFSYPKELEGVSVGDVLDVRFNEKDGDFHTVYTAEISNDQPEDLIKQFSGVCNIIDGKGFGFIGDVFLSPEFVDNHDLLDAEEVQGAAMPSYDKRKGRWGWKAFKLS